MKLLRKLRHLLWPFGRHDPPPAEREFVHRMQAARRHGIEQQRASNRVQREMRREISNRANVVESAYLHKHWEGRDE